MNWSREVVDERYNSMALMLFITVGITALVMNNYMIVLLMVISIGYFQLHSWYFQNIGKKLIFINEVNKFKLLMDEEGQLKLRFRNEGMPIFGATLRITMKDSVAPIGLKTDSYHSGTIEVQVPFSIQKDEDVQVRIPVKGIKRGIGRISRIQIVIPHLFGSGDVILEYKDPVKDRTMVFPKPVAVSNTIEHRATASGEFVTSNSLFHDRFQTIGTRDYMSGDRFQDIHWKASARKQELQTKLFVPSTKMEWMIALNISDRFSITHDLEKMVEYTTFILHKAVKENIPFSLVVNVRSLGATPFLYLPVGTGHQQLQKGLELLATLSKDDFTVPFPIVLQYLSMHQMVPAVLIQSGHTFEEERKILGQLNKQGIEVIHLKIKDEQGVLLPWNQTKPIKQISP